MTVTSDAAAIELEFDARVHYALSQCDVPVVKRLAVRNTGAGTLQDITVDVRLGDGLAMPQVLRIDTLGAGQTFAFDRVDLRLAAEVLRTRTERSKSSIAVRVTCAELELARCEAPLEVYAIDEWPGLRSLPALLAAFVMPNHPSVGGLLARTAARLRQESGDGALDGYQRRDPARVVAIAAATFAALRDCGISYANPPASFADDGQRVRLPDRVLGERVATCLDLALLHAALLEQCGLHALLVIVEGHAFTGVWTSPDSLAGAALEDGLLLRKRVDLGEIALVESAAATVDGGLDFVAARAAARRHLDDLERFRCAIDLVAARRERILPLAVDADAHAGRAALPIDVPVLVPAPATPPAPFASEPAPVVPAAETAPESRLERWQRRLLDVGLRNRLVAFRETKRALRVLGHDLALFEDALADGASFTFQPRSESTDAAHARDRELHRTRTGVDLEANFLVEELARGRLHTPLDAVELERRLLETWRDARTTLEESGVNTLCLALGMLVWFESPSSGTPRKAPILLVPVELARVSVREGFRLKRADDDVSLNETLLEKLRTEFGIDTRGLDELPEDEHGIDVAEVLRRFRRLVRDVPRWDVVDEAWVAPFSFTKFLMWRDLADREDALRAHPIVQHLVERPGLGYEPAAEFVEAADLDDAVPPQATFCPLDADSSQLAAVVAAAAGRSFVLEGPPGTGKSQTIANLIAQCLATGKRVLFVAEKMAALEVVKRRLDKVGLGPFCLELHSNKTSKREVLDALRRALETANAREPEAWNESAARLAASRAELNGFVRALHRVRSFGESVFAAQAQLIAHRDAPRVAIEVDAATIDVAWVERRREALDRARTACAPIGVPDAHALGAVRRTSCDATLPERAIAAADAVRERLDACDAAARALGPVLAGLDPLALPAAAHEALRDLVALLLASEGPAPALLLAPDFTASAARAQELVEELRARDVLRAHVRVVFGDAVLGLDLDTCLADLRAAARSIWPLSWWRARSARARLRTAAAGGVLGTTVELIAHVEQAIELRRRNAAFAAPEHAARGCFGARLWNAGEPAAAAFADAPTRLAAVIDWAGRVRRALAGLAEALPVDRVEALRARCAALAADAHAELAPGTRAGDALRTWLAALAAHAAARTALDGLLELDPARAWHSETVPFAAHQRARCAAIRAAAPRLFDFCHWRATRMALVTLGLRTLAESLDDGRLAPADLAPAFERGFRAAWLAQVVDTDPALRGFHAREHERRIRRFAELDEQLLATTGAFVVARLAAAVPRAGAAASGSSEVGILLREIAKKRRHLPLRRLFASIPNLLARLEPCFLMSPLSVAQYLGPELPPFDLVVFDEASQVTPWDAIGALSRGGACVVVGDSKQLPPTTFFQLGEAGDDDAEPGARAPAAGEASEELVVDLESILDECAASGFKRLGLRWHYRSRHESLITFSNYRYYDNSLLTFPAPHERGRGRGVSLVRVDGVYDRSRSRTNPKEAASVVADLLARLRAIQDPTRAPSFGIVTFSRPQQELVLDLLERARRDDPGLETWFADTRAEPVFVKNLENVQGDERDVILFSIGYGPDLAGKVAMNFGPLNAQGGERRLNVAITRARQEVVVHATLRPEQIDLTRTNAAGVRHLREFLEYAERGPAALAAALVLDPDAAHESPFERDVDRALSAAGHSIVRQVGCSGYRIDLAVRDPEQPGAFLLGIECDGASYHSARTARERDRLREAVLAGLGWKLVRIWSTDWWRDPAGELARLGEAIAAALAARPAVRVATAPAVQAAEPASSASIAPPAPVPALAPAPPRVQDSPAPTSRVEPYVVAAPALPRPDAEGFFLPSQDAAVLAAVLAVLEVEAPIHADLLCRRVAEHAGLARATARVRERVLAVLAKLGKDRRPTTRGEFLWSARRDAASWRGYRSAGIGAASRDADAIPPEEIANAALDVLRAQIAMPRGELARETARALGFARSGARVEAAMQGGIEMLLARDGEAQLDAEGRVALGRA